MRVECPGGRIIGTCTMKNDEAFVLLDPVVTQLFGAGALRRDPLCVGQELPTLGEVG